MTAKYLVPVATSLVLAIAPTTLAADAPPKPLALIKQMDAAMRTFGPGTVDVEETLRFYEGKPPNRVTRQMTWHLKMNSWTDFVESLQDGKEATENHQSEQGTVYHIIGDTWFIRTDEGPDHAPLPLAFAFPQAARPEGWARPVAKPVLDATRVVATEYDGEPALRIEFPVDTMRDQAIALTLSLVAPPLRSITIGRDDHLPRAWTGFEERNPSHATYTFSRASRPYTADDMAFHLGPGVLEVSSKVEKGREIGVFKGPAPDFSLKSAVGRAPVRLSNLRGRPILLILRSDNGSLGAARRFVTDFKSKRLAVLVVTKETPARVLKALPKGGVPFAILSDKDGKASAPYDAGGAEIVLIGKDGRVLASGQIAQDLPRFRGLLKACCLT
jgi:peroxiredoxin